MFIYVSAIYGLMHIVILWQRHMRNKNINLIEGNRKSRIFLTYLEVQPLNLVEVLACLVLMVFHRPVHQVVRLLTKQTNNNLIIQWIDNHYVNRLTSIEIIKTSKRFHKSNILVEYHSLTHESRYLQNCQSYWLEIWQDIPFRTYINRHPLHRDFTITCGCWQLAVSPVLCV